MADRNIGILSKGDVYIRRWEAGVLSKNIITVQGMKLEYKVNAELIERRGKGRDNWNDIIGSVAKKNGIDATLGFQEVSAELMAIMLMGTSLALTVAGGTVTGESITLKHDIWVKTARANISASAITGSVLGTDFLEHKRMGAIKALSTGNIVNNTSKTLGYTYGAITGTRILAGTVSQIDVEIWFDGVFLEDDSNIGVRIPKITLTPNTAIDLMSDGYVSPEFTGKAIKLATESAAIIFDDNVVYA